MRGHYLGSELPDGLWGGLIGFLIRGEAEMAIQTYVHKSEWESVATYLYPVSEIELNVLIPRDAHDSAEHRLGLDQFAYWETWATICAFSLLIMAGWALVKFTALPNLKHWLNLDMVDAILMIFLRKFVAQCE